MHRGNMSSLGYVMACHLLGINPLTKPMMIYWSLSTGKKLLNLKFESNYWYIHLRKCVWKGCPSNIGNIDSPAMNLCKVIVITTTKWWVYQKPWNVDFYCYSVLIYDIGPYFRPVRYHLYIHRCILNYSNLAYKWSYEGVIALSIHKAYSGAILTKIGNAIHIFLFPITICKLVFTIIIKGKLTFEQWTSLTKTPNMLW